MNCETYYVHISPHETPQIQSRKQKYAKTQICLQLFRIAYKTLLRINNCPTLTAVDMEYGWGKGSTVYHCIHV